MTVLLVLTTVVVFLLIDHFYSRQPAVQAAQPGLPQPQPELPRLVPAMVGGFQVPENVRFHPGHTWALSESPTLVRVGIDDFASKLMGKFELITLPQRGQWIRQGQKVFSIHRDGSTVEMLSPIEGTVTDINDAILRQPSLAQDDPYGDGWMLKVEAPDAKTSFRNLLSGALARWWTEEAATRLQRRMPGVLDAVAQDGGIAMNNLTAEMPTSEWVALAKEFFLT